MTEKKRKPATYIMRLSFDIGQITQSLQYNFFTKDDDPYTEETSGALSGTFNFIEGDELEVQVVAKAESKKNSSDLSDLQVNITNCTIVSIERTGKQDLSLFDAYNACTTISEWSLPDKGTKESGGIVQATVTTTALKNLVVTAKNGQWKISGYLSVLIGEDSKEQKKLYFFDPEGSAGGGTDFGGG